MTSIDDKFLDAPSETANARTLFNVDFDMDVPVFSQANDYVPSRDDTYQFDPQTTRAILGKINPYRTGGRAPELALHSGEP